MKNQLIFVAGIAAVGVLLMYMFFFQVSYNEVVVVTTFDNAKDPQLLADGSPDPENSGSLRLKPGLYFRLPAPIQKVTPYSKQIQVFDTPKREMQTVDNRNIILSSYVAWRIENPLQFFRTMNDTGRAIEQMESRLNSDVPSIIGNKYRLDELVNVDPASLKLGQVEKELAQNLSDFVKTNQYGISIEQVGIRRIELPETVTEKVFQRMIDENEALAAGTRKEGSGRAVNIKSEAKSIRDRILSFAQRYADTLRTEGISEAAELNSVFKQDPEFAAFMVKVRTLPDLVGEGSTLFLPPSFFEFLRPDIKPAESIDAAEGDSVSTTP